MPKRKATTATGPKKKKPKSCPSADTPSTMPRCPVKTTSAASRFLAVPELRQLLFRSLDKTSLVCFARVEKALLSDVAAVLYETVDYGRARKKMRCDTVSRLLAVAAEASDRGAKRRKEGRKEGRIQLCKHVH